ncbi:MAG: DUF4405 domain-containing protein [Melioribacteraceae bacterium]
MLKNNFSWRNFVSLYISFSFIIMVISGLVLFISPPGRIANWSYWAIFGLTKSQWQAIHIIFTFLFIISGSFHIYYNWKPLIYYLRMKKQNSIKIKNELYFSLLTVLLVLLMTLNKIPPFSNILEFGEFITESWENETNSPPIAHAEILTLSEFSKNQNLPMDKIINNLKNAKIDLINYNQTLSEVAEKNNLTPNQVYKIIISEKEKTLINQQSKGFGRKTLIEICIELNIDLENTIQYLKSNNINAVGSDKLKMIAENNGLLPIEVYNIIASEKYKKQ